MISKNGIALIILALSTIGVDVSDVQLIQFIGAIGTIISFALMILNQLNRKDVHLFFWKK